MDPKQNGQLDPKLQEVYDRVMGTDTSGPHDPSQRQPAAPQAATPPPADPGGIQMPSMSNTSTTTPSSSIGTDMSQTPVQTPIPVINPLSDTPITPPSSPVTPVVPSVMQDTTTPIQPLPTPSPLQTPEPEKKDDTSTVTMQVTQPLADVAPAAGSQVTVSTQSSSQPETVHISTSTHASDKKKVKISPIILILGAAVFLVAYALIWVKVFGLQLSFLPQ